MRRFLTVLALVPLLAWGQRPTTDYPPLKFDPATGAFVPSTTNGHTIGGGDLTAYQTKAGVLALGGFSSITGRVGNANLPLGAQLYDNAAGTPKLAADFNTRELFDSDGASLVSWTDSGLFAVNGNLTASTFYGDAGGLTNLYGLTLTANQSVRRNSGNSAYEAFQAQPYSGGTLTIASGKTLTANNNLTLSGTDGSTLAIGTGGTLGTAAYVATGTATGTIPLLSSPGVLAVAQGGTGINNSYVVGDLLYASSSSSLSRLNDVATGNVLISGGVTTAPSYGKVTTSHTTGIASISWIAKSANYTAVSGDKILTDTSGGVFTVTLPASPSAGDVVTIADAQGTFATNNLTVGRNSQSIGGSAANMTAATNNAAFMLVFAGGTMGWQVVRYQ